MSKSKGLGTNFDSLVPVGIDIDMVSSTPEQKIYHLRLDNIKPRTDQPRQSFADIELEQLAQSIVEQGVLQPIIVTATEQNMYTIVAGERRWRAAGKAGLIEIPAIIRQVDDLQQFELAVLENIQRSDLNALEIAKSIYRLHVEYQQSYEDIAKKLGKAYTTIVNSTRLLQLPEVMQQSIANGSISEGHGRALLSLTKMPEIQNKLYNQILSHGLSVRQAESMASQYKKGDTKVKAKPKSSTNGVLSDIDTKNISAKLGAKKVEFKPAKKGGKIVISYNSDKQLTEIVDRLGKV